MVWFCQNYNSKPVRSNLFVNTCCMLLITKRLFFLLYHSLHGFLNTGFRLDAILLKQSDNKMSLFPFVFIYLLAALLLGLSLFTFALIQKRLFFLLKESITHFAFVKVIQFRARLFSFAAV